MKESIPLALKRILCGLILLSSASQAFYPTRARLVSKPRCIHISSRNTLLAKTTELASQDTACSDSRRASEFLSSFQTEWNDKNTDQILRHFVDGENSSKTPFWRDMVAFTWNIITNEGLPEIYSALENTRDRPAVTFELSNKPVPIQVTEQGGLEFWCDMTLNQVGSGKAHFRLTWDNKIHTLLTTLLELIERPFLVGPNRIRGQIHGPIPNRQYWCERLKEKSDRDDYVIIIGGGQAGLALGARLHLMDVPYRILEAGSQAGIAWRDRYPSLHLHDPVWYNHMPYLPFPETWPVLCPRDKIADWMEFYARALDLNVQTQSRVMAVHKQDERTWEVRVQITDVDRVVRTKTLRAKHVVFATGNSSHPRTPKIPGVFGGVQLHSSQYRGGRTFGDKRVVVVGSNNSGFDIVQDLWEQGAKSVTMIQRSPSLVVSTESVLKHGLGPLYRQDAPLHHEEADLVATATPYKMLIPRWIQVSNQMKETDSKLHQGLLEAGYCLDFGPDGTGLFAKSATEGGGFYINMGCAELLIRGDVDIKFATVSRFQNDTVVIKDNYTKKEENIQADVVIYATGFDTMDQWVSELCGQNVANKVGRTWGLGLGKRPKDPGPWEGELRNMWKPTTVDGLWFHGGNLAQSRHYSRFLALQLAARYIELCTPVYGVPKPTEPSNLV